MFQSPEAPSNPSCPFAWYPRKPFGESLCGFSVSPLKPSFASLTDIHYNDSHPESKLSVAVAAMSVPLRGDVFRVYKRKKHSVSAVLSCSGTQD